MKITNGSATHKMRAGARNAALTAKLDLDDITICKDEDTGKWGWVVNDEPIAEVAAPEVAVGLIDTAEPAAAAVEDDDAAYQAEVNARLFAKHGPATLEAEAAERVEPSEEVPDDGTLTFEAVGPDRVLVVDDEPAAEHFQADAGPVLDTDIEADNAEQDQADAVRMSADPEPVSVESTPAPAMLVIQIGWSDTPTAIRKRADKVALASGEKILLRDASTGKPVESVEYVKIVTPLAA